MMCSCSVCTTMSRPCAAAFFRRLPEAHGCPGCPMNGQVSTDTNPVVSTIRSMTRDNARCHRQESRCFRSGPHARSREWPPLPVAGRQRRLSTAHHPAGLLPTVLRTDEDDTRCVGEAFAIRHLEGHGAKRADAALDPFRPGTTDTASPASRPSGMGMRYSHAASNASNDSRKDPSVSETASSMTPQSAPGPGPRSQSARPHRCSRRIDHLTLHEVEREGLLRNRTGVACANGSVADTPAAAPTDRKTVRESVSPGATRRRRQRLLDVDRRTPH